MSKFQDIFDISGDMDFGVVIRDYAQFSGERESRMITKIEKSLKIAAKEWKRIVKSNSADEIGKYYRESNYIYEILLAYLHPEKFHKESTCRNVIKYINEKVSGSDLMEFGGGTGQLCLMMYFNCDKHVTYVDLPSRVMEFAKWRFRKYGANIDLIDVKVDCCDLPREAYDFVVSDAVLEHVMNLEATVKSIYESLKPDGVLYLLFDSAFNEEFPMHISARKNIGAILRKIGFTQTGNYVFFKSNRFGVVIKNHIFHYVESPIEFLLQLARRFYRNFLG